MSADRITLNEMMNDAVTNNGGTYQTYVEHAKFGGVLYERVEHEFGYYVSESLGIENLPNLYPDVLADFVIERIVFGTGGYLGLWQDDNGSWSVDVSHWYNFAIDAFTAGREADQRAIWDIADEKAIDLDK